MVVVLMLAEERGRGEDEGGGETNTVFLCIQPATSSGKLLAPHYYNEPHSAEPEPGSGPECFPLSGLRIRVWISF